MEVRRGLFRSRTERSNELSEHVGNTVAHAPRPILSAGKDEGLQHLVNVCGREFGDESRDVVDGQEAHAVLIVLSKLGEKPEEVLLHCSRIHLLRKTS